MTQKQAIQLFEEKRVRTAWDTDAEKWWFSIIDCIAVLTESPDPRNYWKVLKHRLKAEGNETVTNCNRLKMQAPDGKMRLTDVADTEQLFRLIQSIPSPKVEPFKQWMAQVAAQRIDQMQDPELPSSRRWTERQTDSPERHSAHRRQHTRRGAVTNEHPTLYSHSITYCG